MQKIACLCAVAGASSTATAVNLDMTITSDNAYTLFLGDSAGPTSVIGSDLATTATEIFLTESYSFSSNDFIYISAWNFGGDLGMLFDLTDTTNNIDLSSGVGAWEVAVLNESGRGNTSAHTVSQINSLLADPATTPFATPYIGDFNDSTNNAPRPVSQIASISSTSSWMWANVGSPNPIDAGDNQTVLFRLQIPAPGSLALLGLGGLAAVRRRR